MISVSSGPGGVRQQGGRVRSACQVRRMSGMLTMSGQTISASAARGRRARKNSGVQALLCHRLSGQLPGRLWLI
jgi:hypothetical protein